MHLVGNRLTAAELAKINTILPNMLQMCDLLALVFFMLFPACQYMLVSIGWSAKLSNDGSVTRGASLSTDQARGNESSAKFK